MRNIILLALLCSAAVEASTVTLNGVPYTLVAHPRGLFNGPGSFLDARIKDPDGGGAQVSPKAGSGNPAWVALQNVVTANLTKYQTVSQRFNMRDGTAAFDFAAYWYGDNSQGAAHDAALYMLRHVEYYLPFVCVETAVDCLGNVGFGLAPYGVGYWLPNWMMAYELMYGELTSDERKLFADKMLNDVALWGGIDGSASDDCANATVNSGKTVVIDHAVWGAQAGTITGLAITGSSLVQVTIASTSGMETGDVVQVTGAFDNINGGYFILSIDSPTKFSYGFTSTASNGDRLSSNPNIVVTSQTPRATVSSGAFGTQINVGDWVYTPTNAGNLGIVTHVIDSTHAYLDAGTIGPVSSEALYFLPQDFVAGQCGVSWNVKHNAWVPQQLAYSGGVSLYPPDGGVDGLDSGHNLMYSGLWGMLPMWVDLIDDDVNAAVRSGAELTAGYDWWYQVGSYSFAKTFWTGFHQSGSGYGLERAELFMPGTAVAFDSSLVNGPGLLNGLWAKNAMQLFYANTFPDDQFAQMQWGQPDVSGAPLLNGNMLGMVVMAYWFRNTAEGKYANWWIQNLWSTHTSNGNVPGTNLAFNATTIGEAAAWFWIFTDQSYPTLSLNDASAPVSFAWNQSDSGTEGHRADTLISRTGYGSINDTLVNFYAQAVPEFDHNVFANQASNYGSYKIFKGDYLLVEDFNTSSDPTASANTNGGTASNYIEVGGSQSNVITSSLPILCGMPRSATGSGYAYAMADVTPVYAAGVSVSHAYRHLIDFKKTGTQQFLVDYSDIATGTGQSKVAYYHYAQKGATTYSTGVVTSSSSLVTAPSQLLTRVLAPQQTAISTDTSGGTFRIAVCPSLDGATCDSTNTQAAMMVVHMPATGSGNSLPTLGLIGTIDANFDGVEIDGASPKAALFAKAGTLQSGTSFTGGWTGTAQIAVAGLATGNYSISLNGSTLGNYSVGSSGLLYTEGAPGAYTIVRTAGGALLGGKIAGGKLQ